jgi:hypothetical protein
MFNSHYLFLKKWKINVEAHGKYLHNENTYYRSEEWKKGPRETIVLK